MTFHYHFPLYNFDCLVDSLLLFDFPPNSPIFNLFLLCTYWQWIFQHKLPVTNVCSLLSYRWCPPHLYHQWKLGNRLAGKVWCSGNHHILWSIWAWQWDNHSWWTRKRRSIPNGNYSNAQIQISLSNLTIFSSLITPIPNNESKNRIEFEFNRYNSWGEIDLFWYCCYIVLHRTHIHTLYNIKFI